jgi:hypothetical protein
MPRIPQGNFDAAPSMNVQVAKPEPIKAVNSQQMRAMGQRGIQLANTWDMLSAKANALEGVTKAEEEVNKVSDELETFARNSQAGKFEGKLIGDYANERLTEIRNKHLSSMAGNSEQISLYDSIIAPKMQSLVDGMYKKQSAQITDFTQNTIEDRANLLFQKMENGTFQESDLGEFDKFLNTANGVLPASDIAKYAGATRKTLAINASRMIANEGWSPEVEQKVRAIQSKLGANLTEAEKLAAENNLQKNIKQGYIVAKSKAEQGYKEAEKATQKVDTYVMQKGKLEQTLQTLMTVPVLPYEDAQERQTKINNLAGKMIAAEVSLINNNVLNGDPAKIDQDIQAVKARIFGERAPANADIDDIVRREIAGRRSALNNKGTALSMFMEVNADYAVELGSKDPNRVSAAVSKLNEFYNSNNVSSVNRTIVPTEFAAAVGKSFDKLAKGSADSTGEMAGQLLGDIQAQYGDLTGQAIADIISMGGGTESGKTNVPASLLIAHQVGDQGLAERIMGARNRLDDNKKLIDSKKFKQIDKYINASKVIAGTRNGLIGDNLNFVNGYADSVKALAASYMVGGTMDADDAVEQAEQELSARLTFSKSGDSAVVVPNLALKANQMTPDELDDTVSKMSNFENLSKMVNGSIAWDKLAPDEPQSTLGKALAKIQQQPTPDQQARMAQRLLRDNLVIVNNGNVETNATAYIRTPTKMIPLIMNVPSKDGSGSRPRKLDVNMIDMIKANRSTTYTRPAYGAQEGM